MNNLTRNYSIVVILSNPSILIELEWHPNFEFWISEKQIAKNSFELQPSFWASLINIQENNIQSRKKREVKKRGFSWFG